MNLITDNSPHKLNSLLFIVLQSSRQFMMKTNAATMEISYGDTALSLKIKDELNDLAAEQDGHEEPADYMALIKKERPLFESTSRMVGNLITLSGMNVMMAQAPIRPIGRQLKKLASLMLNLMSRYARCGGYN